jgi:hypothetical protein
VGGAGLLSVAGRVLAVCWSPHPLAGAGGRW